MKLKVTNKKKHVYQVDLGEIEYTDTPIKINHDYIGLSDVYGRPSDAKKMIFRNITSDCYYVNGYGLRVISHNCMFFTTSFQVVLNGTLYEIVDYPTRRVAYTNDKKFDFSDIKTRIYGEKKEFRKYINGFVKPYLKKIGAKKARIDYLNWKDYQGYELLINGCEMNEKELDKFNKEYYGTEVVL